MKLRFIKKDKLLHVSILTRFKSFLKKKSTAKKESKERKRNPGSFIEVSIFDPNVNIITTLYLHSDEKSFRHDGKTYDLDASGMSLQMTRKGYMPSYVFVKGRSKPYDFTNQNEGVPSRVVTLLYNPNTYKILIEPEHKNLNLVLVIIGVITLIVLAIYAWLHFGHGQIPDLSFLKAGGK